MQKLAYFPKDKLPKELILYPNYTPLYLFPLPLEIQASSLTDCMGQARMWPTGRVWAIDKKTGEELVKTSSLTLSQISMFATYLMAECWENIGEHGHIKMSLQGYFVLISKNNKPLTFDTINEL